MRPVLDRPLRYHCHARRWVFAGRLRLYVAPGGGAAAIVDHPRADWPLAMGRVELDRLARALKRLAAAHGSSRCPRLMLLTFDPASGSWARVFLLPSDPLGIGVVGLPAADVEALIGCRLSETFP